MQFFIQFFNSKCTVGIFWKKRSKIRTSLKIGHSYNSYRLQAIPLCFTTYELGIIPEATSLARTSSIIYFTYFSKYYSKLKQSLTNTY